MTDSTATHRAPPSRRRRHLVALALLLALAALGALGCVSTVTPPPLPEDPTTVYLIVDARHHGVVLPRGQGDIVEYGYGDWSWYALGHDAWYHVFATVLWPTQGTLGRREHHAPDDQSVHNTHPSAELEAITVSAARAKTLLAELDAEFAGAQALEHWNEQYCMAFVPHARSFWMFHNCCDAAAGWLEELGCSVSWAPLVRIGLRVAHP